MLPLRRAAMGFNVRLDPAIVSAVSVVVLLFIGWLDYLTGYEFGFFIFYFIPVSISAWFGGERPGLVVACASALCWFLSDKFTYHPYSKAYFIYWEMFMRWISFLTTAVTISRIKRFLLNEERLNAEIQRARLEVGELKARVRCTGPCDRLRISNDEANDPNNGDGYETACEIARLK
jgi:hypothetical protein